MTGWFNHPCSTPGCPNKATILSHNGPHDTTTGCYCLCTPCYGDGQ